MRSTCSQRLGADGRSTCPPPDSVAPQCLTSALSSFDWHAFLSSGGTDGDGDRFFNALLVMIWRVLRGRGVTPWMLGISKAHRWVEAPPSPALVHTFARRWQIAQLDLGVDPTLLAPMPGLTDDFFDLAHAVAEILLDPARMVKLVAQATTRGRDLRALVALQVGQAVYDLHREHEPLRYNVYNNVRVALGRAWCLHRSLVAMDGLEAPQTDVTGMPRGRLLLSVRFHRRGAAPERALGADTLEEAIARRALAAPSARALQGALTKDSAKAAEALAELLPALLGDRWCRGDVVVRAVTRWCAPCCGGPEEVCLDPDHEADEPGDPDEADHALRAAFACVRIQATGNRRRAFTTEFMIAAWEHEGELPTVSELRAALEASGDRVVRSVAGDAHQWFTRALRAAYAAAASPTP